MKLIFLLFLLNLSFQDKARTLARNRSNTQKLSGRTSEKALGEIAHGIIGIKTKNLRKLPETEDINKLEDHQLLADLPTLSDIVKNEILPAKQDPFMEYPTVLSIMPAINLGQPTMFTTPNPAFTLGDPMFVNQYSSLNLLNPSVTMSLISPYMNYMNQNWVNPAMVNPYMLNPYFTPGFGKKSQAKNPETITHSGQKVNEQHFHPPTLAESHNHLKEGDRKLSLRI